MNYYLIGYSGHAYVTIESALSSGLNPIGYFEPEEKTFNPYKLKYFGSEALISGPDFNDVSFFAGIGNNAIRASVFEKSPALNFINIVDKSANVSPTALLKEGIYIGKNAIVNALSKIGTGVIINTGAIVEHECEIGDFVHIAPGAVLCGNICIGEKSLIGANSVVRPGIKIGKNVVIGAGSVVVKDVPDNSLYAGNPSSSIKK